MKLTVSRQELLERLSDIQNVVEKRNTMPVLSHFLLTARKGGSFITATDIETAIREPIAVNVTAEGVLCIPARKLFEIIKEVDGDVTVESVDSQWIKVTAGKSSFRLACLSPDEFPAWPEIEESSELTVAPEVLASAIERTIYSAGESDTRYTLNGLLFHVNGDDLVVVGTDGHRLAMVKTALEGRNGDAEIKVIVPRKTASEFKKFLNREGKVSIRVGKNHVLFRIADVEFLARLIDGTYPNYVQVIPAGNEKKLRINRDAFVKALKRVSVMSRERSNAVKVEVEAGAMNMTSSNPDVGEARDEVEVSYGGEPLATGFNARYLLDVLSAMGTEEVAFELQDPLSPTLLMEAGSEDYKCVVMPMRI